LARLQNLKEYWLPPANPIPGQDYPIRHEGIVIFNCHVDDRDFGMKTIGIVGSPRKNGNTTFIFKDSLNINQSKRGA
jgi:hypothetical protein